MPAISHYMIDEKCGKVDETPLHFDIMKIPFLHLAMANLMGHITPM